MNIPDEEKKNMKFKLLYFNVAEQDIMLKSELEEFQMKGQLDIKHSLQIPPSDYWNGFFGILDKTKIILSLEPPSENHLVLLCGPPGMVIEGEQLLMELGHQEENIYIF